MAHLGCSPAEITWKAGVQILSLGATKNGAMAAEAVIFFDRALARGFEQRRKRAGHLWSKLRYVSAQLDAYLTDGFWLRNATHANAMATRLAAGLSAIPGASLAVPVQANEIFVTLPEALVAGLLAEGFGFYRWDARQSEAGNPMVRLVTSYATDPAAVEAMIAAAQRIGAKSER